MSSEKKYVEYGIQLSLAILGGSTSYFIDFSNSVTLLSLIFVPLLFGYTAYISQDGFNEASLLTLITLIFSLIGGITAILAIVYSIGNLFVSIFSGGVSFKEFYASTSIPLLIVGILIGSSVFSYGTINPDFKQEKVDQAAQKIGKASQSAFGNSELINRQREQQLKSINRTARTTVILTTQKVLNESKPSNDVRLALQEAQTEVPNQIYSRTKNNMQGQKSGVSERVSRMFTDSFAGSKFILVIPVMAGFFYSLQPLTGILTAIFATLFLRIDK